jgi:acyl-CoA reductase-like NAD-dependent aldehyde dehydrogenase
MSKRLGGQASKSGFTELLRVHQEASGDGTAVAQAPEQGRAVKRLGKSADPDYAKLTCYVRKETLLKVKRKLLDNGEREISELVEELMGKWLQSH